MLESLFPDELDEIAAIKAQPEARDLFFEQLVGDIEMNDLPKRQEREALIARGLNAFSDTRTAAQYFEMFKYGRQAAPFLSQRFMLGTAPAIAEELVGASYGRALADFNAFLVEHRAEPQSWRALAALGLLAREDTDETKTGEVKGVLPGRHIKGDEIARADPNARVRNYLVPAMRIAEKAGRPQKIGEIFRSNVAAQMVSILATQQARASRKDLALVDCSTFVRLARAVTCPTTMRKKGKTAYPRHGELDAVIKDMSPARSSGGKTGGFDLGAEAEFPLHVETSDRVGRPTRVRRCRELARRGRTHRRRCRSRSAPRRTPTCR